MVVIDDQLVRAHSALVSHIEEYFAAHSGVLELACPPIVVPGGEAVKNDITHCFRMLERVNDVGLDRQSFVTVIGGGAVLDMVSFATAIAHRGVRTIRMPTTVLAQADSGFAVKNSVNLFGKKNFIGTFVPPFAVINDLDFLSSLNPRDRIAGISEAVKVALLRDPSFYRYIETHTDAIARGNPDVMATIVQRSAELHLAHICGNGDPFELGSARPLDFGHWAAHKLESMTNHRLRHGEAVAIGIALDLTYSAAMGYLDRVSAERILRLLEAIGFSLTDQALLEREADGTYTLIRGLKEFREHLGGELHITLLRGIGDSFEVTQMDESRVIGAIESLATRDAHRTLKRPLVSAASLG
jgi:3-dehydroquinate synthase